MAEHATQKQPCIHGLPDQSEITLHQPDYASSLGHSNDYGDFRTVDLDAETSEVEHPVLPTAVVSDARHAQLPPEHTHHTTLSPHLQHPYTRQIQFAIAEEFELAKKLKQDRAQMRMQETAAINSGTYKYKDSYLGLREPVWVTNLTDMPSTSGAHAQQIISAPPSAQESSYVIEWDGHRDGSLEKACILRSNPHNRLNHQLHSALHCPCCLFYLFLCCVPGVYLMQRADIEFKRGHDEGAKRHAKRATVFLIVGAITGIILMCGIISVPIMIVLQGWI